jgi:hypothetical protein
MERSIIVSYGGGTQSAAICVLIAQGRLTRPERIIMADTGREASQTWDYLHEVINPYLSNHGLAIEIASHSLATVDLYGKNGDLLIPAYTQNGMLPGLCSNEWKKRVVSRYLRQQGYGPSKPVNFWIGISLDEIGRAKPSGTHWMEYQWPLLFDVTLRRHECKQLVIDAGLPEPPKSSCWMCPYRSETQWAQLREHFPADFAHAVELERDIHAADQSGGVWLTKHRRFINEIEFNDTSKDLPLFGEVEHCDSGFCWV